MTRIQIGATEPGRTGRPGRIWLLLLALHAFDVAPRAIAEPPSFGEPPSIALIVIDTLRADAVSAYGSARDTTPNIDALAREGLLYRRAYANAAWTLPSHATLFTGLLPEQHLVGVRRIAAANRLTTIAERLRAGGYETFGISENGWVSPQFNLAQGFEHFALAGQGTEIEVESQLASWWSQRTGDRPWFLFVNLVDPHIPYRIRQIPNATRREARRVSQQPGDYLCRRRRPKDLQILYALYRKEVSLADRRIGRIRALLAEADGQPPPITVVTSDHGQLFGEGGVVGHMYSVANHLLRIPLIVHGLPDTAPARLDGAVQLADLVPSLLAWAGLPAAPGLSGEVLPTREQPGQRHDRAIVASFHDMFAEHMDTLRADPTAAFLLAQNARHREHCPPDAKVFGTMHSVISPPYKLSWREGDPPSLYDLRFDPGEEQDIAASKLGQVRRLMRLSKSIERSPVPGSDEKPIANPLSPEVRETLGLLGYLDVPPAAEDDEATGTAPLDAAAEADTGDEPDPEANIDGTASEPTVPAREEAPIQPPGASREGAAAER